ncbi:MAG: SDR family oxidoreductase [Bacteroidales bacterium]|nr:SDR family oxidoreductase [Bacteroidales bacterium]
MDKVVLITGANRGIGLEIGKQLLANDFTVVFTMRNMATGRPIVNDIRKEYKKAWFHQLDVSEEQSIADVVTYFEEVCERLDVLINNAAILHDQNHASVQVSLKDMKETMETNLYGPMMVTRAVIPFLKKSDDPRVINLSSTMGQLSTMGAGYGAYRISKTALNALTVIQSKELARDGIKVNSMCPGWVKTEMGGPNAIRSLEEGAETAVWLATSGNIPSGKFFKDKKEIPW